MKGERAGGTMKKKRKLKETGLAAIFRALPVGESVLLCRSQQVLSACLTNLPEIEEIGSYADYFSLNSSTVLEGDLTSLACVNVTKVTKKKELPSNFNINEYEIESKEQIIAWTKTNKEYLKFKDHLDFLKNAQSYTSIPETLVSKVKDSRINPGLNTVETAWFIAELIENLERLLNLIEDKVHNDTQQEGVICIECQDEHYECGPERKK